MNATVSPRAGPSFQTLAEIAASFPGRGGRPAVKLFTGFRVHAWSYAELHGLALRCAAHFKSLGVEKGDRVMIWAPNGPEWAAVFCACAMGGAVLVPLDARNTAEFAARVAKATGAKLLIRSQFKRADEVECPQIPVESLLDVWKDTPPADSLPDIHPDDLAEIVYTSGTTGDPKGVMLTQGNIAANVTDVFKVIRPDETYHLLSVLPLSHALEQTGGFWTPLAGGADVMYLTVLKPSALFEVFGRESVTVMVLVPRLLAMLKQRIEKILAEKGLSGYLRAGLNLPERVPRRFRKAWFYPVHRRFNTKFHLFVSGGAALDPEVERFWKGIGFEVLQGYGLTETSPVLTVSAPGSGKTGTVGRPLDRVELRLGPDNEILARGPNVFQGYYNRPELNGEIFEDGWFKTGDVGELDEDGCLYIRGRKKDIIVTGDGVNVYPEDLERELEDQPGVREACVIGAGEDGGRIHAVLLPSGDGLDPQEAVREANKRLAPEQQIETVSLWPDPEFPKTTTMKIKKNEVRKVVDAEDRGAEAPRSAAGGTPVQRLIAEMAGVDAGAVEPDKRIGLDLGLSSMDRVELTMRLEEEFRIDLDDNAVMDDTPVSRIEELIAQRGSVSEGLTFRRWTRSLPCQWARAAFQFLVLRPLVRAFCKVRRVGLENLEGREGPLFFVANHTSHLDTALMQLLPPAHIRRRICPAAYKEYFDTEGVPLRSKLWRIFAWNMSTVFFNIFPFPQTSGYRRSMMYAGELVDEGWSILLFPEGQRSRGGEVNEFREGVGLMTRMLQIPVVPVAIRGGEAILGRGRGIPRRGVVKIAFGEPFIPGRGSHSEVTAEIKGKILALLDELDKLE